MITKIKTNNMKRLILTTLALFVITMHSFAQNPNDSIISELSKQITFLQTKDRYKLYPTENIYNLLKLDTKTGMIWQVQWGLNDGYEGVFDINLVDLRTISDPECGSFELYPTKNMYQFILLDKINGRQWHVQWGIGSEKRWIRRI